MRARHARARATGIASAPGHRIPLDREKAFSLDPQSVSRKLPSLAHPQSPKLSRRLTLAASAELIPSTRLCVLPALDGAPGGRPSAVDGASTEKSVPSPGLARSLSTSVDVEGAPPPSPASPPPDPPPPTPLARPDAASIEGTPRPSRTPRTAPPHPYTNPNPCGQFHPSPPPGSSTVGLAATDGRGWGNPPVPARAHPHPGGKPKKFAAAPQSLRVVIQWKS